MQGLVYLHKNSHCPSGAMCDQACLQSGPAVPGSCIARGWEERPLSSDGDAHWPPPLLPSPPQPLQPRSFLQFPEPPELSDAISPFWFQTLLRTVLKQGGGPPPPSSPGALISLFPFDINWLSQSSFYAVLGIDLSYTPRPFCFLVLSSLPKLPWLGSRMWPSAS